MIVWYQSSCCSMGLNGPWRSSDRGNVTLYPIEEKCETQEKISKIFLSVENFHISTQFAQFCRYSINWTGWVEPTKGKKEKENPKNFLSVWSFAHQLSWPSFRRLEMLSWANGIGLKSRVELMRRRRKEIFRKISKCWRNQVNSVGFANTSVMLNKFFRYTSREPSKSS